jgi:transketolase C-terminal domain/subunit
MRRKFASGLYELMKKDKNIILIAVDLGYGAFDKIRDEMPEQFFNPGAAEQVAVTMAVGMALQGRIPVVYTITPFLIFRPFEAIRNYLDHESIPVILVGSGRGKDYAHEGFSHDASDHEILKQFKNIQFIAPENDFNLSEIIYSGKPTYLNLKR